MEEVGQARLLFSKFTLQISDRAGTRSLLLVHYTDYWKTKSQELVGLMWILFKSDIRTPLYISSELAQTSLLIVIILFLE